MNPKFERLLAAAAMILGSLASLATLIEVICKWLGC